MFSDELIKVMEEKGLSTSDLSRMTGISKASISQYRNGKNSPSAKRVALLENVLGVKFGHAELEKPNPPQSKVNRISVRQAAKIMDISEQALRIGIQQGVFPWAYGVRTSEKRWVYIINADKLRETEFVSDRE